MPKKTKKATVEYEGGKIKLKLGKDGENLVQAIVFDKDVATQKPDETLTIEKFKEKYKDAVDDGGNSGDVFCVMIGGRWICLD